jgi:hypothetical protein
MGTRALSPGIKQLRYEAEHSPPISAEVKKTRDYPSTPPYFMAQCIVKYKDRFTLCFAFVPYSGTGTMIKSDFD